MSPSNFRRPMAVLHSCQFFSSSNIRSGHSGQSMSGISRKPIYEGSGNPAPRTCLGIGNRCHCKSVPVRLANVLFSVLAEIAIFPQQCYVKDDGTILQNP